MEAVFELNSGFYGAPRIHRELLIAGLKVGHHRVARLLRCAALNTYARRGFRPYSNSASKAD
jgi:hypothetical protein